MNRRLGSGSAVGHGATLVLVSGLLLAGCSSSGSDSAQASAKQDVCTARTAVQTSFQTVADDLKSLNFGQAKTDLPAVGTAIDNLAAAQSNLDDETKAKIEPDVTTLKSSLASVQSATTVAQATEALGSAKASFDAALQTIAEAASCS